MSLKVFLLCCTLGTVSASAFSQGKIDLTFKDENVATVIDYLQEKTDYTFVYREDILSGTRVKEINIRGGSIDQVLDAVLRQNGFNYEMRGNLVVISRAGAKQQPVTTVVSGVVCSSDTKAPEEYVLVYVRSTNKNTITDKNGRFKIEARTGDTIVFSKIGFNEIHLPVEESNVVVYLEPNLFEIDQVTVISNQNINDIDMREIAGSITTIDMAKIAGRPEMDMLRLLQGQVPGLMVTISGELGAKPEIRLRGNSSFYTSGTANEPLFILDGIMISSDVFLAMNPDDFDQLKVLKDAAATALYGIKAANGVIEITSKRGYVGKPTVTVRVNGGVTFRGPRGVEMMKSAEKLELERLLENPSTPGYYYSEAYIRKQFQGSADLDRLIAAGARSLDSLRGIDTDWYRELVRINSYQNYSANVRGGTEKNSYYYSLNYGRQGGRIKGNDIQRITMRATHSYVVTPKLNLSFSLGAGYSKANTPNGSDYDPGSLVYELNPYERKKDPVTGEYAELVSFPDRTYADLTDQFRSRTTSKHFEGSLMLQWQVADGLDISAVGGADYNLNETRKLTPHNAYLQNVPDAARGSLSEEKGTILNLSANVRANYNKSWDRHEIGLSANWDSYMNSNDLIGLKGYGLPSKITTVSGINQALTGAYKPTVWGSRIKELQMGLGAAASYSFDDIYEFYASYKADASSMLPKGKRWNTAWAVGAGWSIGHYGILLDARFVTDIKFRASYGETASMAGITAAMNVPTFGYAQSVYGGGRILSLKELYNTNLKPQQTRSVNIGADIVLFHRFTLGVEYYDNRTNDAISIVPVAPSNGFENMMKNIGSLSNSGIEVMLSGDVINSGKWRWNTALSFSWNRNKVRELYGTDALYTGESMFPDLEVGRPVGTIWGLESLGINPLDGMPHFRTPDGREITYRDELTRADFSVLGHSTPPYMGFVNNSLTCGPFNLSFDIYFSLGGKAQAAYTYVRDNGNANKNAVRKQTKEMWFRPGDENMTYHTPFVPGTGWDILRFASTQNTYKTDVVRLNNVQLNYRMPAWILDRMGGAIKFMHVNVQLQNIYTFQPEKDKSSIMNTMQPVLSFGVNVTF
ncbi:SusC/RagA family TonB-linked outer membrane protein [Alistipes sp. OttesenSCG-928-B03]|nr:SusC/RagA family TonB-linked outer membrane protein [Alistipes sp. OttesenSCG-928-B03]